MAEENLVSVVNCSEWLNSAELISEIIGQDSCEKQSEDTNCYHWEINNKYYTANVQFLVAKDQQHEQDNDKAFNAYVVLFDVTEKSFHLVKQWLPSITSHNASVLLLVGSKTASDEEKNTDETQTLPRLQIVEWCIKHSFEFIDLNEEIDPEDDFPDTVGVARIIQALQTTDWPSLQMKDGDTTKTPLNVNNVLSSNIEPNVSLNGSSSNDETTDDNPFMSDLNTFGEMVNGITNSNDERSFEELFSQMQALKGKASNLPHSERKAYAEQVALAFWRAIGGDEEEIEELN